MNNATVTTTSVSDDGGSGGDSYSDLTDKWVERFSFLASQTIWGLGKMYERRRTKISPPF